MRASGVARNNSNPDSHHRLESLLCQQGELQGIDLSSGWQSLFPELKRILLLSDHLLRSWSHGVILAVKFLIWILQPQYDSPSLDEDVVEAIRSSLASYYTNR